MAQRGANRGSTAKKRDENYYKYISQGYYEYGSHAHRVQPVEEEPVYETVEYVEMPARKPQPRAAAKPKKAKNKPAVVMSFGLRKKTSIVTYALALFISAGAILSLTVMALTMEKRLEVNRLKSELKDSISRTAELNAGLHDGYDLDEIEYIATTKLKMGKPEEHQIVRLSVPKQSYMVQYDGESENGSSDFGIKNVFARIFSMFSKD